MQPLDKDQFLENLQKIYVDDVGVIVDSCHSIFKIEDFHHKNIRDIFPLVDSIFEMLSAMARVDFPIQIQKIKTTFPPLKGFYDFVFEKVIIQDKEMIILTIKDYTKLYTNLKEEMQKQNEVELKIK
jgi:hypothetical protein